MVDNFARMPIVVATINFKNVDMSTGPSEMSNSKVQNPTNSIDTLPDHPDLLDEFCCGDQCHFDTLLVTKSHRVHLCFLNQVTLLSLLHPSSICIKK